LLTMQQNAIPITATITNNQFIINFPDFITGVFDVQILMEGTLTLLAQPTTGVVVSYNGSVTGFSDLLGAYGSGTLSGDVPSMVAYPANGGTSAVTLSNVMITTSVSVQPATGGVDNQLFIGYGSYLSAATIGQTQIIVRMTNPALAQSAVLSIPTYINSAGVVIQPY